MIKQFLIEIFLMSQVWQIDNCGKCCPCKKDDDDILTKNTNLVTDIEKTNSRTTTGPNVSLKNPQGETSMGNKTYKPHNHDVASISEGTSMTYVENMEIAKIDEFLSDNINKYLDDDKQQELKNMALNCPKTGTEQSFELAIANTTTIHKEGQKLVVKFSQGKDKKHINIAYRIYEAKVTTI
jgi:uncharacterized protein YbcV (DUF1398 family)